MSPGLIDIVDHLTSAQVRAKAIAMAAHALPVDQRDALIVLAGDCHEIIELAKDAIAKLKAPAIAEGGAS